MIMRAMAVVCAMLMNATEPVRTEMRVCCEIQRGIYEAAYEMVEESFCDSSSNRLLGYGRREVVEDALCLAAPPPVAFDEDYGNATDEETWELIGGGERDAL